MLNFVSKLVTAAISPLGTALVLGLVALALGIAKRQRLALGFAAGAIVWLAVWSTPAASNWLRGVVEGEPVDAPVDAVPSAQAIVILGGGISTPPLAPYARPDLGASADRVWYGASLYHAGKAPVVVLSGGSDPRTTRMSEAAAMLWLLRDLGVPESAMWLEEQSRNTAQNARFTATMLKERGISHVLLVTSALHMKRAVARFEAEGLAVTPAPTDFGADTGEAWRRWIPDTAALDGSARTMKEIVGRLVER